jgi:hypothetical protein
MELWKGFHGAKEGEPTKNRKRVPLRKKKIEKDNRIFTCVDPLQRYTVKPTDSGDIVPDPVTGYFTVKSAGLANELKSRYPWLITTEHEKMDGDPTRAPTFRINGMREGKLDEEAMIRDGWIKVGEKWVKRGNENINSG